MKIMDVRTNGGFELLAKTGRGQAATMVLEPGGSTGGPRTTGMRGATSGFM